MNTNGLGTISNTTQEGVPCETPTVSNGTSAIEVPSQAVVQNCLSKTVGASSTTFQDDAATVSGVTRSLTSFTDLGAKAFDTHDIADFLGKPVLIDRGSITTLQANGQTLSTGSIATQLLTRTLWADKHKGYNLIRATAHLKFVVNANPFQQGRIILSFVPMYSHLSSTEQAMRCNTISQLTTQPNVELDIADTSCELAIPYVSPLPYYEKHTGLYDWGNYFLNVLNALRTGSGGATSANWSLFLWFTDVELAAPMFPQSSMVPSGSRSRRNFGGLHKEEETQAQKGVISSSMSLLSKSSMLLGSVPGIGSYMKTLGSAAGIAGSIAQLFGFSKPICVEVQHPMFRAPYRTVHTADGTSLATPLSLHQSVSIAPMADAFGASVDEMSMAFLNSIPSFWGRFTWSTGNVHEALLWNSLISPGAMLETSQYTKGGKTATCVTGQPSFMLSRLFKFWRGGVDITLKFVKTKYHTGRLVISFSPVNVAVSLENTQYLLREIVDLSTASEITLKIPFMRSQAWCTNIGQEQRSNNGYSDFYNGVLNIHVLDELRAPETASTVLDVLMYVKPADDFELAVPVGARYGVFAPESGVELHGSRSVGENRDLVEKGIGNAQPSTYKPDFVGTCIGDPLVSVKQLLTAGRRFYSGPAGYPGNTMTMNPSVSTIFLQDSTNGNLYGPGGGCFGDFLAIVPFAYAFCRGGYVISNNSTASTAPARCILLSETTGRTAIENTIDVALTRLTDAPVGALDVVSSTMTAFRDLQSGTSFKIPHMDRTPIRMVRGVSGPNPSVMPLAKQYPDVFDSRFALTTSSSNGWWTRAAADDYCLGYFIGFPPIVISIV
ncbi:MAG: capsid protein [Apis dicistrovirus 4]|nr:MAG: capsid protein [Apis dicistrovirus 4]